MSDTETKCPNCGKFFPEQDNGLVKRHTVTRGTDLFRCAGSGKSPIGTRVVYR